MHSLQIQKVVNGYIVTVGCRTFVFEEFAQMMIQVGNYLEDPAKAQAEWEGACRAYDMAVRGSGGIIENRYPQESEAGGLRTGEPDETPFP